MVDMTALQKLLETFQQAAQTEREKGGYFEELVCTYLRHEATYKDLYKRVWLFGDWVREHPEFNISAQDTGIDLVAKTRGTDEFHAIQCKFYAEDHRLQKRDIDSFFTASGQKPFAHRIIVATTNLWSVNAEAALLNQQPAVTRIDLHDLENSQIDWRRYQPNKAPELKQKKTLRSHQQTAVNAVCAGLQSTERGKLIMACGTGNTFTSLKIAEQMAGKGKRVLFLVPSLSLLSQVLTEWTQESTIPLHSFAVCSDTDVGKKRKKDDDFVHTFVHELRYPATTNASALALEISKRHDNDHMSVVYATYHSIEVLSKAQHHYGLADFDLIIGDEAHRTTGATFENESESSFVKVHDGGFIRASKRIYMTATPRIYADSAKAQEEVGGVRLCSMDDEQLYGPELHCINFSEAVSLGLLCDYKVIVLTVDEAHVSQRLQSLLADENNQLKVDDAAKIIGCWKAINKQDLQEDIGADTAPMKRAVAFCQVIEPHSGARTHKVSSKQITAMFQPVVEAYQERDAQADRSPNSLRCEARHIDGSMNASEKEEKLNWLKAATTENTCHILHNVRCLSEGVDVPALDAVLFLTPRNSPVDVVQSVGRVMRKALGKERGYVILPVVIPTGIEPHQALNDNKTYKVVWNVLQALRSHDDRFDAMINKLDLIGNDRSKMEVIAITDQMHRKIDTGKEKGSAVKGRYGIGENDDSSQYGKAPKQQTLQFEVGEIERAIYAKVVKKCGNRLYWTEWATDIAKIAKTRITAIVSNEENSREVAAIKAFAEELRDDLNDSITDREVIEMLAQHLITKPVFDALFEGYSFASQNPVSRAMQGVLDVLQEHHLDKEADTLEAFYQSVRMRAEGIHNAEGKQKIVAELYDKFFRHAFPQMSKRLGIVYTPVEIVDFILRSVNDLLKQEFGQTLGSEGVHILDPFTGTGTFITRLLQSGLINSEELPRKYNYEIHANEIVLLAYYIAAINIEAIYHSLVGGDYVPFEGICLTDTFQMYEKKDLLDALLPDNSDRRKRQVDLDIRVILSNPPYSSGQKSENDNAKNVAYPSLDKKIGITYAKHSAAKLRKNLYDSYIRAIRWGSDRLGDAGVMAYVSGSAWIERSFADGLRQCLAAEYTNLYVFSLRGDIRKNMLSGGAAKEGGNVFGSGSMTGIAITFFVKNPAADTRGNIYFHDIGDDIDRQGKLDIIRKFGNINGISEQDGWRTLVPDDNHDWLNHVIPDFGQFMILGDKQDKSAVRMFENYSLGVVTNRDAWCYNASRYEMECNIRSMIAFYHAERERYHEAAKQAVLDVETFVDSNPTRISWTRSLKRDLKKNKALVFAEGEALISTYRPFSKQWMYYGRRLNEMVYQMPRIFPNATAENRVICVTGTGARSGFSALMVDAIPNLDTLEKCQCFPLKLYQTSEPSRNRCMFEDQQQYTVRDSISDEALTYFQAAYSGEVISKEDLFYYLYGILHAEEYRTRYRNNLIKRLPRLPAVSDVADFRAFSEAGYQLAELHLGFESVDPWPVTINDGQCLQQTVASERLYHVEKMKFGMQGKYKDQSTVIYNPHITITGIPTEAYDYIVNGKPAIQWVMDRQCVKTNKASTIVNDTNRYAIETMNNPAYPMELLQRVITVSLETIKIVKGLPSLDVD